MFFDPNKNRKLAKNGQAYIFMLWYFGEKKGLCIGMAMLPFQKLWIKILLPTKFLKVCIKYAYFECEFAYAWYFNIQSHVTLVAALTWIFISLALFLDSGVHLYDQFSRPTLPNLSSFIPSFSSDVKIELSTSTSGRMNCDDSCRLPTIELVFRLFILW